MNRLALTFLAAFAVAATGCSKMKPLTAEQKLILTQTMDSSGRAESAPKNVKSKPPGNGVPASIGSTPDQSLRRMEELLAQAKCNISYTAPTSGSGLTNIKLSAGGETCPIQTNLVMEMGFTGTPGSGSASFGGTLAWDYSVSDPEYRKLNDIDAVNVHGTIRGGGNASSAAIELNLEGSLHSQTHGSIPVRMKGEGKGNQSAVKGEITMTLEYRDFVVEFKNTIDGQREEYFINDEKVTEQEFNELLSRGGTLFSRTMY